MSGAKSTYDAENRMKTRGVTGGSMTYTYDAGGTMVKRTNADGSSTVYVGGIFEKNFNATGIATGTTKYYSALGRTIALRTETSGGAGTLSYLLADHLGTTVGTLDASGNLVANSKTAYWPYGGTRSATAAGTDKLYTGQQQELGDAGLGLYNYNARFYSTVTGRFVSADTVAEDGLNRFAYVRNNPLRYVDPTGHCTGTLRALVPGYECTKGVAESFIRCAFQAGSCQGDDSASRTWRAFAVATLDDREFFGRVTTWAAGDAGFWTTVHSIRRLDEVGDYYLRYDYSIFGSPGDEGGGVFTIAHEADHVEGLLEFYVDYSYIDFRVGARLTIAGDAGGGRFKWLNEYMTRYLTSVEVIGGPNTYTGSSYAGLPATTRYIHDSLFHSSYGYAIRSSLVVNAAEVETVPICPWFCSDTSPSRTPYLHLENSALSVEQRQ